MKVYYLTEEESLADVLNAAEENSTIYLQPRDYREKLVISTRGLTLKGIKGKTRIVYGDYAKKIHADGLEYNTFRTYTVNVIADNVTMVDLCIENDAYDPKIKGQAVALSVYADNFKAEGVTLKSAQDTLFLGPLPDDLIFRYDGFLPDNERYYEGEAYSSFHSCEIFGSVDYVFGCGAALFEDCSFINIDDGRSVQYVCAPAHSLKQKRGFMFVNCDFLCENGLKAKLYLARPWRDYGKCTFICSRLCDNFDGELFDRWNDTVRYLTARFEVYKVPCENMVSWGKELTDGEAEALLEKIKR